MSEVEFNILVGAIFCVLGAALSRIEDILSIIKTLKKQPSYLCSQEWHTYHYTRDIDGGPFVRYEKWTIKRALTGHYSVTTFDPKRAHLVYSGSILSEGHNLLITLKKELDETVFIRIKKPVGNTMERTYGLYLTTDFGHREYCSGILVSSEEVDDSTAVEKLSEHIDGNSLPTGIMLATK